MADKWQKANSRIYGYFEHGMRESVRIHMNTIVEKAMWNHSYTAIWGSVEAQEKDGVFRPMRRLRND